MVPRGVRCGARCRMATAGRLTTLPRMTLVFTILAVAVVFAIAAVVIGREARRPILCRRQPGVRLRRGGRMGVPTTWASTSRRPSARRRPPDHQLAPRVLPDQGVSSTGHSAQAAGPAVVGGAETVDFVLTRAQAAGSSYTPVQVHAVLDAEMVYLEAIGAIGPPPAPRNPAPAPAPQGRLGGPRNPPPTNPLGCGFISGTRERRWSS